MHAFKQTSHQVPVALLLLCGVSLLWAGPVWEGCQHLLLG